MHASQKDDRVWYGNENETKCTASNLSMVVDETLLCIYHMRVNSAMRTTDLLIKLI